METDFSVRKIKKPLKHELQATLIGDTSAMMPNV